MASISPVRMRQIALVTKDLSRAEFLLTKVFGSEVIFRDPAVAEWGLENILVPLGGDIIEVVSPFKEGTTTGRLLLKRGDGGYMMIMQTTDALARRNYLETNNLARVIFTQEFADSILVQYHPKGIPGGMMPELDSHHVTAGNPTPLTSRFSPWHACGGNFEAYSAGMKRHADLRFESAVLRLRKGESAEEAAEMWERLFGVQVKRERELGFTNMSVRFVEGNGEEAEGLESFTVRVAGRARFEGILERASREGLCGDGWIDILGVKWYFTLEDDRPSSKL